MIRVLIADDHSVVRQGLKQILSTTPDIMVVDEATNGQEVLQKARTIEWDVLVLDISMPGRSGFDILLDLHSEMPGKAILVMSMYAEDQYARRVLKSGAAGYLTKESVPEELITALRKVVSGGKYVSPALAEQLAFEVGTPASQTPHESLSDREFQVMRMIAAGQSVSQIAEELSLSVKTVSTYRARILEKMNLKTNADLIHYAIDYKLV
jgi:two-component system, NarL family, invasion response regulator UvrY